MSPPVPPEGDTEESKLRAELLAARAELREASLVASEREQRRLAQALHDTVCQTVSGVHLMCRVIARKIEGACPDGARDIEELGDLLHLAVQELHDLTQWLRPIDLEGDKDLVHCLEELARSASRTVPCELRSPPVVPVPDRFAASQLCQIAHEAVRHAVRGPATTGIILTLAPSDDHLTLAVEAAGHAFDDSSSGKHIYGLDLIRNRANVIGATVNVETEGPKVTTLTCHLPLHR